MKFRVHQKMPYKPEKKDNTKLEMDNISNFNRMQHTILARDIKYMYEIIK